MTVIALIDADNFYVSVERIFRADLQGKPVVVLSSNDANVIARSNEVKVLGVKMGTPAFEIRDLVKEHGIIQLSSNFSLYGDISARVMKVIALFTPTLEKYSIDEAFADFSHVPPEQLTATASQLRAKIFQYVGISVSIGIATSKVLAKIATEKVKKHPEYQGVFDMTHLDQDELDTLLNSISIEDVWGVGYKSVAKLQMRGKIFTAKQLRDTDLLWIRRVLNVVGVRIVLELRGVSTIPLETTPKPKQGILTSQSFGRPVENLHEVEQAVAMYTSVAAVKLRTQRSLASRLSVFIHTNFYDTRSPQYANSASCTLAFPTAFTPDLIAAALTCVRSIYQTGYRFKKVGVHFTHITSQEVLQADLFGFFSFEEHARKQRLMHNIDELNVKWGQNTVFYGAIGFKQEWRMKQTRMSPHYTTKWSDIVSLREKN